MRKLFFITIVILSGLLLLTGCTATTTSSQYTYTDVTPAEAKVLIEENPEIIIIDASPYYAEGHLPGAINYYISDGSLSEAIPALDKSKTYLVYCTLTNGSVESAEKLIEAGFQHVYRLDGNYQAWVDAGYPVEK